MKPEKEDQEEDIGWSSKQYLAFFIALLQTILLPTLVIIVFFIVLALFIGHI